MQVLYATMQCNGNLYNVHDILSNFCDFDFDLIFFVFCGKHKLTVSFLKDAITHSTSPYLLQIFLGTPSKCMFCLIILEWRQWSCLTFNQSIEMLILGFSPFCLEKQNLLLFCTTRKHKTLGPLVPPYWRIAMDCRTLVCDQVKLSWLKVIEWCHGSVDPTETWWHGLILKEFI